MPAIDPLFEEVVRRSATDLHLAVQQRPLARIHGELVPLRDGVLKAQELEEMLLELVTPAQRARLAAELVLDVAVPFRGGARLRGSYYVTHTGIAAAFRRLPARVPTLSGLAAPDVARRLAERTHGLLLLAGPASSGLTTLGAALVDHVNSTRSCHVVTIERPIEIIHEPKRAHITQREVGTHAPSFASALAAVARESADVVAISELDTAEEIELALRLAADGALVIAACRAGSVTSALARLLAAPRPHDGPRVRALLAEALAGVIVQHLVRTSGGRDAFPLHEVLVATPTITSLVSQGKTEGLVEAMMAGDAIGMQMLDDELERLVLENRLSPAYALDLALDKDALARALARPG